MIQLHDVSKDYNPEGIPVSALRDISLSISEGEYVAFFEDTRFGRTTQARVGEVVGKGKVERITLDGIEYRRGEAVRRIGVRQSLTGASATLPTLRTAPRAPALPTSLPAGAASRPAWFATTTQPAPPATVTTPKTTNTDSDGSDILERMRRRRLQELGR